MAAQRQRRVKDTATVVRRKAIYLRKSRDETHGRDDILAKHRMQLVEMCERNGWTYETYEEVGSADSLDDRPKMMQLLDDIEDGRYDGVVVMEYERLSRGSQQDAALIFSVFQREGVQIITPTQRYDLNDETSEALLGVASIFARMEYRKIKRRLRQGKINGAKQGKWVQGPAPYPYTTIPDPAVSDRRIVAVDEEQFPHYEMMLSDALAGVSPGDIAIKLNVAGARTNRGGTWVAETVQRVLLNPFHMGRIIYGKTKAGKDGERIKLDPDEWITSEGDHPRLKTPEEHARIMELISSRRRIGRRSLEGNTPLSGLVKCAVCNEANVSTTHQSTLHRGRHVLFACTRRSPFGEICPNGGVPAEIVYRVIETEAAQLMDRLTSQFDETRTRVSTLPTLLEATRAELAKEQTKLSNLIDLAISGLITKDVLASKKVPIEASIQRIKATLSELESSTATGEMPMEERKQKLSTILRGDFWTSDEWTHKDRHTLLTTLIDHITLRAEIHRSKSKQNVVGVCIHWR